MSIYNFNSITIDGDEVSLEQYKGKVLVIVNTASECGFTPQYEGLEKLYQQYKDKGFEILGFPSNQFAGQEPGEDQEIKKMCAINYGVSFQLFNKSDVRGENAQPLFKYLAEETAFEGFDQYQPNEKKFNDFLKERHPQFLEGNSIKWNFTKFLIGRDGNIVSRYESTTVPEAMASDIEKLLEESHENHKKTFMEKIHLGEHADADLNIEGKPLDVLYGSSKTQNM
jgi:glutathione peroxidase